MATWVRQGTGTAPTMSGAALVGRYSLDNGTAPGDFNPAGVTQVDIAYTITGSGFSDDTWTDLRSASLDNGTVVAASIDGTDNIAIRNVASNTSESDTSPNTGLSTAQWEAMAVSGAAFVNGSYATYSQSGMPDGGTMTMSACTVTITYTPATTDRTAQVAWAELEVPAPPLPDYVRGWARGIETVSSSTITINKPTGTVENDIMYAFIIHESASGVTDTPPSGWSDIGTNPLDVGAGLAFVYKKVATASEGSSYVWTWDVSNQAVGYIVTVKNTYTEDVFSLTAPSDGDADLDIDVTLSSISTSATGLLAIVGDDPVSGADPYFTNTTGMDKRDETADGYIGAIASFFTDDLSSQTSSAQTFGILDSGGQIGVLLVSFIPSSTDRTAQVGWTELEIPTAPRTAQLSWAELEIPNGARTAIVSWAELEVPTAPRTAQVSWAELEVPTAPRTAQVSWAEIELPEPPKAARVSWAELEIPDGARAAIVSWAELEVPTAPRTVQLSWAEMEIGDAPRTAQVSWAELEIPTLVSNRTAQVSWAELEVPTAPRTAQISWAEMELPDGARTVQVTWAEMELPDAARAAIVAWAELEVPTAPRRAQVAWAEFETPDAPRTVQVSWAELEIPPGPSRSCIVVWTELAIPDAPGGVGGGGSTTLMLRGHS